MRFGDRNAVAGGWIAPFLMSGVNTRIVHRSNAILEDASGKDFADDETMLMEPFACSVLAGTAASSRPR